MPKFYTLFKTILFGLIGLMSFNNTVSAQTTTWDGTIWDAGAPDNSKDAIFNANYSSVIDFAAKTVLITNNSLVTISSGHTFTVDNNINIAAGSSLVFENNASLLQINAAAINTGNITFKRNATAMREFEYTYWSSPVTGQTLAGFSPLTDPDRYFSFDTAANTWVSENGSNTMIPGKGYAISAPDDYTPTPQIFNGEFTGNPNNGNITAGVIIHNPALLDYNLLGNPYPSAISVVSLINNTTLGTLYFWTHNTAITNNSFSSNDYAIRTKFVGTQAVTGGSVPGAYVASGQGFFASSSATGTITFTNTMRVSGNNSQFFKNTETTQTDPQYYYTWLNMTNTGGAFKQLAFGYEEGATNGYDFGTDAAAAPGTFINFYSLIGTTGYAIQGRAFPWNITDQIALGYSTTIVGPFDITLDHNDTFFDSKDIFLQDLTTGTVHNLKTGPYTFNTAIGTFNSRFVIHYVNPLLSNEAHVLDTNTVAASAKNNVITIESTLVKIKSIEVYDLLGRLLFETNNLNQNQYVISTLTAKNQALAVKIKLENNQTVIKKLMN
ncbi:T9SS sorting signal type C domain-containing protein [Flavobacterium sp. GT3R68]|uniref:T9SS sorting signal type C domain-containing protein n=1 Tax=Flavobacterium sp. GT3R68 TaxID=2594437 RepID=UPI000F86E589|nr:T9SS sorting signal type C domain-containing protein [Flavobacterium sp. GT3R68]RTY96021.1 T9SS type A sorting domain-containing protein [Flavobacterium sp. GSN2]TRW93794.1 T9SS type A sorting domain-containing protein [Flavobacterium sp. GT3R68]